MATSFNAIRIRKRHRQRVLLTGDEGSVTVQDDAGELVTLTPASHDVGLSTDGGHYYRLFVISKDRQGSFYLRSSSRKWSWIGMLLRAILVVGAALLILGGASGLGEVSGTVLMSSVLIASILAVPPANVLAREIIGALSGTAQGTELLDVFAAAGFSDVRDNPVTDEFDPHHERTLAREKRGLWIAAYFVAMILGLVLTAFLGLALDMTIGLDRGSRLWLLIVTMLSSLIVLPRYLVSLFMTFSGGRDPYGRRMRVRKKDFGVEHIPRWQTWLPITLLVGLAAASIAAFTFGESRIEDETTELAQAVSDALVSGDSQPVVDLACADSELTEDAVEQAMVDVDGIEPLEVDYISADFSYAHNALTGGDATIGYLFVITGQDSCLSLIRISTGTIGSYPDGWQPGYTIYLDDNY